MSWAMALSIRQPWAWAILHAGKDVETREWRGCSHVGPVLIHASKGCTRDEYSEGVARIHQVREQLKLPRIEVPPLADLPRGDLCGVALITRYQMCPYPVRGWHVPGRLSIQLDERRALPREPYRGALGFFRVRIDDLSSCAEYAAAWDELVRPPPF